MQRPTRGLVDGFTQNALDSVQGLFRRLVSTATPDQIALRQSLPGLLGRDADIKPRVLGCLCLSLRLRDLDARKLIVAWLHAVFSSGMSTTLAGAPGRTLNHATACLGFTSSR